MHRVLKSYTLSIDVVDSLDEFAKNRPDTNKSRIVEKALQLWFDTENERSKEEFFKENPDGF